MAHSLPWTNPLRLFRSDISFMPRADHFTGDLCTMSSASPRDHTSDVLRWCVHSRLDRRRLVRQFDQVIVDLFGASGPPQRHPRASGAVRRAPPTNASSLRWSSLARASERVRIQHAVHTVDGDLAGAATATRPGTACRGTCARESKREASQQGSEGACEASIASARLSAAAAAI